MPIWWSRPRRRSRCCPSSSPDGYWHALREHFRSGRRAALFGAAARRLRARLHQLGGRPVARGARSARRLLPLRQAPPGAFRRIHPVRLSLVHRPDEHPARRLQPRPAESRRPSRCTASASRRTSATRICSARSSARAFRERGERTDDVRQPQQHRLVRRHDRDRPAPAHLAHAQRSSSSGRCCAPPTPAPPRSSTITAT